MVSVCMAVKNGSPYLRQQILSILPQLHSGDELIISDDHSTDSTKEIIHSLADQRIWVIDNPGHGVISNFENALRHARGDYIFLSDQDDIWDHSKIARMLPCLTTYGLVVCDCHLVDEKLKPLPASYFERLNSGKGLFKNLVRNSYMGCCMAFRKTLLEKALPFPGKIAMHDQWIGLVAEIHASVYFLHEPLVSHRRHHSNTSTTFGASAFPLSRKVAMRYHMLRNLIRIAYA